MNYSRKNILAQLRANWFSVGLVFLILLVLFQRYRHREGGMLLNPVLHESSERPIFKGEKFTDKESITGAGKLFGRLSKSGSGQVFETPNEATALAFFKRFEKVAMAESKKYQIPASVILATAYVNSFAGRRACAREANNFFALSCDVVRGSDTILEGKNCKYRAKTAWEGFRTFSLVLIAQDDVKKMASKPSTPPATWILWLSEAGLSDVDDFEEIALEIIQKHNLTRFDHP